MAAFPENAFRFRLSWISFPGDTPGKYRGDPACIRKESPRLLPEDFFSAAEYDGGARCTGGQYHADAGDHYSETGRPCIHGTLPGPVDVGRTGEQRVCPPAAGHGAAGGAA